MRQVDGSPSKNFTDAAVGNLKNPGYITWTSSRVRQLYNLLPGRVGKWTTSYEKETSLDRLNRPSKFAGSCEAHKLEQLWK